MGKIVHEINFEQWSGLSEKYHNNRPVPPEIIPKIILSWLRKKPDTVIDIGCGTGLSTILWNDIANNIIGIEPNDDMRITAENSFSNSNIVFRKGVSNDTNLPSDYAEIITVSQAFHWMDIDSTLAEFYRVLKPGGVLAIYDFVMPPVIDWEIERATSEFRIKCSDIVYSQEAPPVHNDKSTYNARIISFGKFRYSREVECHSEIKLTPQKAAEFLVGITDASFAVKIEPTFKKSIDEFYDFVKTKFSSELEIIIPYRMVIALK